MSNTTTQKNSLVGRAAPLVAATALATAATIVLGGGKASAVPPQTYKWDCGSGRSAILDVRVYDSGAGLSVHGSRKTYTSHVSAGPWHHVVLKGGSNGYVIVVTDTTGGLIDEKTGTRCSTTP